MFKIPHPPADQTGLIKADIKRTELVMNPYTTTEEASLQQKIKISITLIVAPDSLLILEMLEPHLPIKPPIIVSEIIISSVT